ncbi:type II toxin-antitoxin system HicB family antitoxin [Kiloniella antarctica]|uniref:Type II toxin-antitoxin system HicB family antitoxin n=1 Tax=Kiloniella antarctica TaxID=1550907 RepID=A0ABW5BP19_9PROT
MKQYYPAVIEKDREDLYGAVFPDLPGCVTSGESVHDVMVMAEEALSLHITGMHEDGDELPTPSEINSLSNEDTSDAHCITLVGVTLPGKKKRYNFTIDEYLIDRIDAISNNRSEFLAQAARERLDEMAKKRMVMVDDIEDEDDYKDPDLYTAISDYGSHGG